MPSVPTSPYSPELHGLALVMSSPSITLPPTPAPTSDQAFMDHHLEDTSNTDHNRSEKALPPIFARSLPPLSPLPVLGQPRQIPPHPFCVVPQGQPPPWVYLQVQCKELPLGGASARCRLTSDHTQLMALRMLTR